jgi:YVTN family beta-propeller protein
MSPGRSDEPTEGLIEGILQRGEQTTAPPDDASELLTFLFADIRGYTKFTQRRGDEAAAKLTAKFAMIVRALVADFNGTVFEQRGDEVLCVFTSPRRCLRLAVALQQRFVEETVADANLPLAVGIGIDAGEAIRGPDGFRGGALNLAARLCERAKAGEVLASSEVTHLARNTDGLRYLVLEDVALKGLTEPVRPIRVIPDGEDPAVQIAALLAAATPATPAAQRMPWLPGPLARRPKRTLVGASVLAAVVIAASVVAAVRDTGAGGPSKLGENSVGLVDPHTRRLVGQVGVDPGPIAIGAGYGSVWTVNADANTVSRVDRSSRHVRTIGVGVGPSAIAIGLNAVWIANSEGTVSRIDPTNNQVQTITVGAEPGGLAIADGSVWVTNTGAGTVSRIDPTKNRVVELIPVGASPTGIAAGRDVWVANSASGTVSRINGPGRTHTVIPIPVGNNPKGIAVVGNSVWVSNNLDDTLVRIATSGTSVAGTVPVGSQPTQLAALDGHLWVATQATESITEVDPASRLPIHTIPLGAIPGGITAAGGKLWVTTLIHPARHHGGTIHLAGQDPGSLDPNYLDSPIQVSLLNDVYDGLVGFRHATGADGTAIVPNLATSIPSPTNGGRTYTFQLRNGIRWSTGKPATVYDVRRGLQRAIATGNNPLQQQIVGAAACRPTRCELPGVVVDAAAHTVTVTLVQPEATFINDLAGGTFAAPAGTPLAKQPTRPIPATGPYRIAHYVPGKLLTLTRNPFFREWSAAAEPAGFPDSIDLLIEPADPEPKPGQPADRYSPSAMRAARAVETGQADWADTRIAAPIGTLEAQFGSRLRVTPTETMHGLFLNTRIPPFNDVRVRRALSFALDRAAVADNWFTPATITCQMLPPNFPAYRPYCPYTLRPGATGTWQAPDLATALRLVKDSPTRGMTVTVYAEPPQVASFRPIVTALRTLGYRARIAAYSGPDYYFDHVGDSSYKIQAGAYGWVPTDASAANLLTDYTCPTFTPASLHNQNPAQFCDPSIDRLEARARRLETPSPAAANDLWAQVDHRIVDAAPWIPLVTPRWVDVLSTRVHNYQRNPFIGVFFDQMWVR